MRWVPSRHDHILLALLVIVAQSSSSQGLGVTTLQLAPILTRYTMSPRGRQRGDTPRAETLVAYEWHNRIDNTKAFYFWDDSCPASPPVTTMVHEVPFDGAGVGHVVWPAGIAMALWAWGQRGTPGTPTTKEIGSLFSSKDVVELGAGVGVPGLSIARTQPTAGRVVLTDSREALVESLGTSARQLTAASPSCAPIEARPLNWVLEHQTQEGGSSSAGSFDLVLGSDVCYYTPDVKPLSAVALGPLLHPGGKAVFFSMAKRVVFKELAGALRRCDLSASARYYLLSLASSFFPCISSEECMSVDEFAYELLVERLPTPPSCVDDDSASSPTSPFATAETAARLPSLVATAVCLGLGEGLALGAGCDIDAATAGIEIDSGGGGGGGRVALPEDVVFTDDAGAWVRRGHVTAAEGQAPRLQIVSLEATKRAEGQPRGGGGLPPLPDEGSRGGEGVGESICEELDGGVPGPLGFKSAWLKEAFPRGGLGRPGD